jgi:hypothetical protein
MLGFLVTPGRLPSVDPPLEHAGGFLQVVLAALLLVALARADRQDPPELLKVGLLYGAFYFAFVLVSTTVFDDVVPLDERLLVPLVPPLLVAIAWLVRAQPVAAAALVALFAVVTLQQVRTTSLQGRDYSGKVWSAGRIDSAALPRLPLYSNWPAAVAYFTGRSPRRFPRTGDAHTGEINTRYEEEMDELIRLLRDGRVAFVIFGADFLQIPTSTVPIAETPPLRGLCRPASPVVTVCVRQRA